MATPKTAGKSKAIASKRPLRRAVSQHARAAVQARGEATHRTILERAGVLARVIGLKALTIGGLAEATGLSKSGLFAHFGSKENLQVAVIEAERQEFLETVVLPAFREPRGEPRVRSMFEAFLLWAQREGGCFFMMASAELDDDDPSPAREALQQAQRDWIEMMATAARICIEEGHFRADLDPRQFAFQMKCLMLGYHHYLRLLNDRDTTSLTRHAFETMLSASRP